MDDAGTITVVAAKTLNQYYKVNRWMHSVDVIPHVCARKEITPSSYLFNSYFLNIAKIQFIWPFKPKFLASFHNT